MSENDPLSRREAAEILQVLKHLNGLVGYLNRAIFGDEEPDTSPTEDDAGWTQFAQIGHRISKTNKQIEGVIEDMMKRLAPEEKHGGE